MARDVWITGCGLLSALGEGREQHWDALHSPATLANAIDTESQAPYPIYPIRQVEFDRFIKRGDQRAMGPLMLYGVHAAGLALQQAGVAGQAELLQRMHLIAASCGGERDLVLDEEILREQPDETKLNQRLSDGLRPTLFLAQLPNLFAGNISIVHGVAGSSRTFMGEEPAGLDAARVAAERIAAGQGELFLVGAAFNASRADQLLVYEPGGYLLTGQVPPLWNRPRAGMVLGSAGAFLVLESREHAEARGAAPLAWLRAILSGRSRRAEGEAAATARPQRKQVAPMLDSTGVAVLSGACGSGPITAEERALLAEWDAPVRGIAMAFGHAMEASFLVNLILAIWTLQQGRMFPPLSPAEPLERGADDAVSQILVTGWGHHRGEGLALLQAVR